MWVLGQPGSAQSLAQSLAGSETLGNLHNLSESQFGSEQRTKVSSSVVTNASWWCKMLTLGKTRWGAYGISLYCLCNFSAYLKYSKRKCLFKNKTCGRGENIPAFYRTEDINTCDIQHANQGLGKQFVFRRQTGLTIRRGHCDSKHGALKTGDSLEGLASKGGYCKPASPRAAGRHVGEWWW